ncbi:hypothetical protein [Patulibacter defluvii]|uniref:hypothetical protein n=1 Tax=Patulibacter defluvii TaxID=3095358 RepID=UPI002A758BDC|nr:hypothetical protein [Patulibacter sp. DM4]
MLVFALLALELVCVYVLGRRVLDRLVARAAYGPAPRRWLTWGFLAPGVALHESAHAVTAIALLGRVERFVPFRPRPLPDGGVLLGEVRYRGSRLPLLGGPLGRALVGLAPLVLVPLVVYVAGCALVPGVAVGDDPARLGRALVDDGLSAGLVVWIAIALSASIGLLPSRIDHQDLPRALALVAAVAVVWLLWRGGIDAVEGRRLVTDAAGPATFAAQLLAPSAVVALLGSLLLRP